MQLKIIFEFAAKNEVCIKNAEYKGNCKNSNSKSRNEFFVSAFYYKFRRF